MSNTPLHSLTSPEPPSASGLDHARLRSLQETVVSLLETDPKKALQLAQHCEEIEHLGQGHVLGQSLILTAQALIANSAFLEAQTKLENAIAILDHQQYILSVAECYNLLGKICLNMGQLISAKDNLNKSIAITLNISSQKSKEIEAKSLNQIAGVEYVSGNIGDAILQLHKALRIWQEAGDQTGQIQCLINIGNAQSALGQYKEAVENFSKAYRIYKIHSKNYKLEATILYNLARTHYLNNDNNNAIKIFNLAYESAKLCHDKQIEATVLLALGDFSLKTADLPAAQESLEKALDVYRQIKYQLGELSALNSLGNLYEKTEQSLLAYVTYHDALAIALSIGSTQGELDARLNLGRFYLHSHSWEDASTQLQLALDLAERTQSAKEAATAHETLCDLYKARGETAQALHHSEELRRIERELFNAERDRQTRNLSIQFEVERAQREADSYRMRTELEQEARQMAERQVEERTAELAQAQHEVVTRLAMAAEYRDGTTGDHTRRVGVMSANLARALGWSEARAALLGIAARLHDVGKMGIPDSILLKSGKLEAGEFTQMQTHTLIGATILSGGHSELLQLAEEIALTHHERWDGGGYPRRLAGTQIPLSGRIVAVADVYDALTQTRPYKKAWKHEEALQELRAQAGLHFDPEVVEAAMSVLCGPDACT